MYGTISQTVTRSSLNPLNHLFISPQQREGGVLQTAVWAGGEREETAASDGGVAEREGGAEKTAGSHRPRGRGEGERLNVRECERE